MRAFYPERLIALSDKMRIYHGLHDWSVSVEEAISIQKVLVSHIRPGRLPFGADFFAGVDVANMSDGHIAAAVVVCRLSTAEVIEVSFAKSRPEFPYIPGLLSFREGPAVIEALSGVNSRIDVLIFDGQGIAHPRGIGIAAHIGLWVDVPTLGVAKKRLIGKYREPKQNAFSRSKLTHKEKIIGSVLRTRDGVKPVFVSAGNNMTNDGAVRAVVKCCKGLRLPEPVRLAHIAAGSAAKGCDINQILNVVRSASKL